MDAKNSTFRQEGNKLIYTRILHAPRELVWEVWTDPVHIKEWWGPDGFTLTTSSMDVQKEKFWKFVMHGHGLDYVNVVEYTDVVKPSLLAYKHGNEDGSIHFTVIVTFEVAGENKTLVTMTSVHASEEVIAELDRKVNAIEGGRQNLNRLAQYVESISQTV